MRVFLRKTYAPTTSVTIAIFKVGIRMVIYFEYNSLSYVMLRKWQALTTVFRMTTLFRQSLCNKTYSVLSGVLRTANCHKTRITGPYNKETRPVICTRNFNSTTVGHIISTGHFNTHIFIWRHLIGLLTLFAVRLRILRYCFDVNWVLVNK